MPRYLIERSFPDGLRIPMTEDGAKACGNVVKNNATAGVTWVHSYVSDDKRRTFCIYDGPDPDSIRKAAAAVVTANPPGRTASGSANRLGRSGSQNDSAAPP